MPDDDVGEGPPRGRRWWLSLAVPAVAGIFAVLVALINSGPGRSPERSPPTSAPSSVLSSVPDERVRAIMTEKTCDGTKTSIPTIEGLSITSPSPGAGIDRRATVRGRASLSSGDRLYFFTYDSDVCDYYFQPPGPLAVNSDGSWEVQVNLSAETVGERVWLYAIIVGTDEHTLLKQVLQHYSESKPSESAYIVYLPPGARSAHVDATLIS